MPPEQFCLGTVAGAASLFNAEGHLNTQKSSGVFCDRVHHQLVQAPEVNFFPFATGSCRGILKVSGQLSGVVVVPNGTNHVVIPYGYDADSFTRFVVEVNPCRRVL
jgi:hypothetical protein